MSQHWYLIHAKPRQEKTAREHLERQQYVVYLPLARVLKRRRDREQVFVVEPLFPRYLFIQLDDDQQNWSPIRSTRGVQALVRFGGVPARVPEELVVALQQQEQVAEAQSGEVIIEFQPGQRVQVVQGPFAGYEAIFEAESGEERVTILLDMIGRPTRVQVNKRTLDPSEND